MTDEFCRLRDDESAGDSVVLWSDDSGVGLWWAFGLSTTHWSDQLILFP